MDKKNLDTAVKEFLEEQNKYREAVKENIDIRMKIIDEAFKKEMGIMKEREQDEVIKIIIYFLLVLIGCFMILHIDKLFN